MDTDSPKSPKSLGHKRSLAEVSNTEKQLWACIHSKGVTHKDVKNLYHKACCLYQKLFLNDNDLQELQNIEYLLWRLHYKFIDEFRKRISQSSVREDKMAGTKQTKIVSNKDTIDTHMEGFRSFLSEASKFYQDLIIKIKRCYGLFSELWFYKNDSVSGRIEHTKMHKCRFVCHRLYICLGDLARYQELYEKSNCQQRNWCVAASYYLESAKIYPDGGNPQNQLAVLATYIGDDFLALYHCIRSLAVKEPFQDALQNLMLLFERSRSFDTVRQSDKKYDFCKPSEWISSPNKAEPSNGITLNNDAQNVSDLCMPGDIWILIIKTMSFFFLESSVESFPSTFISALSGLETLLAQGVTKLSSALESYRNMNLSKAGPYRALHMISILIFIIHNLTEDPECTILKPKNEMQRSMLIKLALTITFTFMGRFVDRCLMGTPVIYFPLLPALLVFVEWLAYGVNKVNVDDEKCESAMRYFFVSFANLLNHLQENRTRINFSDHIALWEDYELRGFIPSSNTHDSLDFSSHWEEEINYKMKNEYRAHRIVQAAITIAKTSGVGTQNWLVYDDLRRKFSVMKKTDSEKIFALEEEEDIVFTPIIRHNSEPIQLKNQPETETSDELLRRASSLLIAQNRALINTFISSSPNISPRSSKPLVQNERLIAAGPPSLSSWVLNGEASSRPRTKGRDAYRNVLKPIEEVDLDDLLKNLSLSTNDSSGNVSPMACLSSGSAPSPSPPLPTTTSNVWFINTTTQPASSAPSSIGLNMYAPYTSNIPQFGSPTFPSFIDHYSPWAKGNFPTHGMQDHQYIGSSTFNGIHGSGTSDFGLFDQWGSTTVYMEAAPPLFLPSSSLLHGLQNHQQRPMPYASPVMTGTRPQPQPLLQYLKEREWQLQQQSPFTGSPYMQN